MQLLYLTIDEGDWHGEKEKTDSSLLREIFHHHIGLGGIPENGSCLHYP